MPPRILEHHPPQNAPLPPEAAYPLCWDAATLREVDYRFTLPGGVVAELKAAARRLRERPLPLEQVTAEGFPLPRGAAFMERVAAALRAGPGFALVDGFPLAGRPLPEAEALFWLLGSLLNRPVAQDFQGSLLHHVMDYGKTLGPGVRGNLTAAELTFHTDSSYTALPPEQVALLCVQPARQGGRSRLVNWRRVYAALMAEAPGLAARGFRPFLFDRNGEHAPGEPPLISRPVFTNGPAGLAVCYYAHGIRRAYAMAAQTPDGETVRFLDTLDALLEREGMAVEMDFQPGQVQLIDNRVIGHARTVFTDDPDPARKRRLIRLWLRGQGGPGYLG